LKKIVQIKKGDLIVILFIGVIILGLLGVNYFNSTVDNLMVEVRINSELVDTFSIEETIEKTYETEYGRNVLSIQDGVVSVTDADCRDFICVETKDAVHSGDSIVCIPNRFTVEIVGSKSEVDVIAQ